MRRFLINILSVLIFLGLSTAATNAKDIKFVQVTDVHYTVENDILKMLLQVLLKILINKKTYPLLYSQATISEAPNKKIWSDLSEKLISWMFLITLL